MILKKESKILVVGNHHQIIQSVLDFDYMSGKSEPSVSAVVSGNIKTAKFWFGMSEVLLPTFSSVTEAKEKGVDADCLLNISSANSARAATEEFFTSYSKAWGAHLFCEELAEQDAIALIDKYGGEKFIAGASGVGFVESGSIKLGAVSGIFGNNVVDVSKKRGETAIVCSSGGMVNELIDVLVRNDSAPSFAVSYGGDKFPITSPTDWCLLAEKDSDTKQIIYFGELGGTDEYDLAQAVKDGRITKPIYAYVAGWYDTKGEQVQFGHAKALAKHPSETAEQKTKALADAGIKTYAQYSDYIKDIKQNCSGYEEVFGAGSWVAPETPRRPSLFSAVRDKGNSQMGFTEHILCTLLEKESVSKEMIEVSDFIFSLLVDHGIEPSGPLNTTITTRAGKDMSSSIASGLLAIGDRFGGAINKSAETWFNAVRQDISIQQLLSDHKKDGVYVMGIGHKKYTKDNNDPRVASLVRWAEKNLKEKAHLSYALSVADITTQKRSNLILNIDGAVAAVILDVLFEIEDFSSKAVEELIDIEFFNSLFILPRTAGLIGNHLTQKRIDEGLFRLPEDEVYYL